MTAPEARALFAALAAEMERARSDAEDLSDLVSEHVGQAPAVDRAVLVVRAQAADRLVQSLDAVGDVAAGLAAGEPLDAVLARIPLSDLAARLRQSTPSSAPVSSVSDTAGDLLLFE
jgi:hypothetical protein